ncbi:WecE Predicted pyridoxal phosphate-dependent enzyme apparently involved in regulation of cell wall biogenesis [uncultured Caudovirales phage]|uniref:WecE Predicted pyridoxal phosphate-dependent enzyme apparently involved in regulation of cell wall biogenesis n=1 Tax=uncultured Caudovirales phage TaxID=2100421 RepID=A0A6J5RAG3_9CAUD|nr:WecE Predicted pyridoxal phosphate-dependent enzyme apparently involved in regulation of cell wall biogenesis [uncultured Caudovirales phage]
MRYPVSRPSLTQVEHLSLMATLSSGQITQGPRVADFENRLADYLNVPYVVACSSGTSALHLALLAAGVQPGDEVLVPDLSFIATANAVSYIGATPVLVEVELHSWNMDLSDAAMKVSSRTRAILPVHLYGVPCDMHRMREFAEIHGLMIVEDAAEALGGHFRGQKCGTFGVCGTFSFYGNKIITTGEGGAIATHSEEIYQLLKLYRGQGQGSKRFQHDVIGFNYRMTDMQASIGAAQVTRLNGLAAEREEIFASYDLHLNGFLETAHVVGSAPWLYTGLLPETVNRDEVILALERLDIETRPIFVPMHRQVMYERPDSQFPFSSLIADCGISLPTYNGMSDNDVRFICDTLRTVARYA